MSNKRRVVVTGIGIVSPLGLDTKTTWNNLLQGYSGIDKIPLASASYMSSQIAGFIKDFVLQPSKTKYTNKMDLFIQYGLQASREAWLDSKLDYTAIDTTRVGVSIGSGLGGLSVIQQNHVNLLKAQGTHRSFPRTVSPFLIPGSIINMLSGICAIEFGLKGPNLSAVTACSTGTHNIGLGLRTIVYGDADIMLVGGSERSTAPLSIEGFSACRALSTRRNHAPQTASRPWDRTRDGFVLSDGASILILEEYQHAIKRNAHIYAELVGFGMSSDGYDITAPHPEGTGAYQAMHHALVDANLTPDRIDYINAHATSTILGDLAEIKAIKQLFQKHSYNLKISSTKSITGHLLGAAGAIEAAFCILALRDQIAPPTINLDEPEPDCSDLNLVPHTAQPSSITYALSNSFGFGSTNGSLIFKKF